MDGPSPVISITIEPASAADREKLAAGLQRLTAEDPTLRVDSDERSGTVTIAGMGELQLEIVLDRLKREFEIEAAVGRPQVAYKETLTRSAEGEVKYTRQTDGRDQYAHVKVHLHPAEPGTGSSFENEIIGGAIPGEYIKPVQEGIREALARGVLAGYPVDDVRIVLYDGSFHQVDSSEAAFRIAAGMAVREAATRAAPALLEPIMRVEVVVPTENAETVTSDLASRRGRVQSNEERGTSAVITATVPLSEMLGYAGNLRSRTNGRGSYSMTLGRYERVERPPQDPGLGVREPRKDGPEPGRLLRASVEEPGSQGL